MDKNQKQLLAVGSILVLLIAIFSKKKKEEKGQLTVKTKRPKSSYSDLIKVSAPILTPFAKLAADKLAAKLQ